MDVHARHEKDGVRATTLFFRTDGVAPETRDQIAELKRVLSLDPDDDEVEVHYSPLPGPKGELTIATRSLLQIQFAMAQGVEIPAKDIERGKAMPGYRPAGDEPGRRSLLVVKNGFVKPPDTHASVKYRGGWYWIADRDLPSKRNFGFVMLFFTLAHTGRQQTPPILTIDAN